VQIVLARQSEYGSPLLFDATARDYVSREVARFLDDRSIRQKEQLMAPWA
jgi:hypothetical protein